MATINEVAFADLEKERNSSRLTELERKDPQRVLADFFSLSTLEDIRSGLCSWLLASFKANNGDQFAYIHLWQQLERLLEASWLLNQQDVVTTADHEEA
ncbi:hypothetical protein [Taibaiella helva]|uniref:hypothetical protein n=1 Tax=Taibaiella helva TaxID=2301235 RepID=UPI000E567C46|nr:hypothetical protein [Taibaiella helva]